MPLGDYLVGLGFFMGTTGGAGLAAVVVARRRLDHLSGSAAAVAYAILVVAAVIAVHVGPLALGVLNRWTALAASVLLLAGAARVRRRRAPPEPARDPVRGSDAISWLLASAALTAVLLYVLAFMREHATAAVSHSDYVHFTMPQIARWIQSGTLWETIEFHPRYPVGAYPNNGDAWYLAFVLPWRSDAFVRVAALALVALAALGTYAIARELRAGPAAAGLFAALVVATRVVTIPAVGYVKPDAFMLATFAAGTLFSLRALRTRELSDLVLAGIGLGLAFGARWYGLPFAAVVIGAWSVAALLSRVPARTVAKRGAVVAALVLAWGGIWLLRNLVVKGNPVHPVEVGAFGVTLFDAPRDEVLETTGFSVAGYLDNPDVLSSSVLPEWKEAIGAAGLVAAGGVAVALAGAWRRARDMAVVLVAAVAVVLAGVYLCLPGTAQGGEDEPYAGLVAANSRYLAPALLLGAATAAWAATAARQPWLRRGLELAALVAVVEGLVADHRPPLAGILPFDIEAVHLVQVVGGLAVLAAAAAAGLALRSRLTGGARRAVAAAAALAVALGVALGGHVEQERFNDRRYVGADPVIDFILDNAPAGRRIGVTGIWNTVLVGPTLPAFGPRFRNHVAYIGPVERGTLQYYSDRELFLDALRRGRYDLVVVGRGFMPTGAPSREQRWLRAGGYVSVVESERFELVRRPEVPSAGGAFAYAPPR